MASKVTSLLGGEVLLEDFGVTKIVTLNREKALNALTWPMVQVLQPLYDQWTAEAGKHVVVLRGSGTKAFCAGGDVVGLAKDNPKGTREFFFKEEYKLNYTIGQLFNKSKNPHISLLDGITMGGGFGLSVHGSHRICTESTLFAMPECALGLFPDVGGSIVLPRLPHPGLGQYLALTGRRLKGADVYLSGIGTHFVKRETIAALTEALKHVKAPTEIDLAMKPFLVEVPKEQFGLNSSQLGTIKRAFAATNTVEEVLNALSNDSHVEFANGVMMDILKASPTSLKVTFEQLKRGAKLKDPKDNFRMEYRISQGFMNFTEDFNEGVRAILIDKTNDAQWSPSSLAEVDNGFVSRFFDTVPKSGDLDVTAVTQSKL
eukprot:PhF_6_TR1496/c0_g1_i1/m.2708/K05605/HIBCH; 3-hydroxyisobutyryl-CoA hydrolase